MDYPTYELPPPFGDFSDLPDEDVLRRFGDTIYEYYGANARSMPWRETEDPYEILVSEIMLQQTQVSRVLPRYIAFLEKWPTIADLAGASLKDVLAMWRGLGYNRRGKALLEIARIVTEKYGGEIPRDEDALRELPAVGPATAAAIRSFAHGIPAVYLETNVRRVYIYFFFQGRDRVTDGQILPIARAALDTADPRNWNYALMDYGVLLKERLPNPNRRSASYTRQSKFEGSDRQVRGAIIAYLVETDAVPEARLAHELPFDPERVVSCARRLAHEGMVSEAEGRYFIPRMKSPDGS